ncbi:MAG: DM13 domain-containing protein [Nanoarchaeota archaeon]|nr:DM13 domain-containing protein [Nanoarchaeota archaeon]
MKKWLIGVGVVFLLVIAGYVYLTADKIIEVQEASPLLQVNDNMDVMGDAEKEQFEKEVDEAKKNIVIMDDEMKEAPTLLAEGKFTPRAHEVMGRALLIQTGDSKVLRFEDFETINGPDLHIWLASSLGDDDYVDLGPIKATKGNVNYDVPVDVDTDKYNKVLVWCVPFRVLFSYAELG